MREPTHEECAAHARIALDGGKEGVACWYPQMGGYGARAVIVPDAGCADVYVWHDGEFPFAFDDGRPPAELHHCNGAQFVAFGELLMTITDEATRWSSGGTESP
ncbi:hypothetical protein [Nonomuraea sp. NPDC049750]|uniref:hypothetical protein n=1 Tax=Nonomuraea sp. NPDC049750 TaxID=3154738 RepID=UPI0033C1B71D